MFFDLISQNYPNLLILPNDKIMLDGYEVDIAIPAIDLAIEWNGIVHYKPIYGQTKFERIKKRDLEKREIAKSKKIDLVVIVDNESRKKFVVEAFSEVKKIIDKKLIN